MCRQCGRIYIPSPKLAGYDDETRERAVQLYVDGVNIRRIARTLGVNHQSVANWVKAKAHQLPPAPVPQSVETVELDEIFTFIQTKKASLRDDNRG